MANAAELARFRADFSLSDEFQDLEFGLQLEGSNAQSARVCHGVGRTAVPQGFRQTLPVAQRAGGLVFMDDCTAKRCQSL